MLIVKIMIVLYMWLILPVLIGCAWLRQEEKPEYHLGKIYLMGMVSEWAAFFLLAKWAIAREISLRELSSKWAVLLGILTIIFIILIFVRKQFSHIHWKKPGKEFILHCLCLLLFILIAVGCVKTEQEEYTAESVMMMYITDTLYQYDATTGRNMDTMISLEKEELKRDAEAPVEAYYAVNSCLCRLHPVKLMKIILPCFLLLFYYVVYQNWAYSLYGDSQKKRVIFTVTVWILYGISLIADRAILFDVFQNPWNGETLFFAGLVPLTIWMLLMEEQSKVCRALQYLVCVLAGELFYENGAFVISLIWVVVLVTEAVKRWKDDRSI